MTLCAQQLSQSGTHRCVVKIFILHGAARRHFHYALGHLWGGALISVPDENAPRGRRHPGPFGALDDTSHDSYRPGIKLL